MKPWISFLWLFLTLSAFGQNPATVRPIRDDIGFCWDAFQMARLQDFLTQQEPATAVKQPLLATISPHDDYLYAGRVYFPLFRALRCREAVIIGLTHGAVRREIGDPQGVMLFDEYDTWRGLRGTEVAISPLRETLKRSLPEKTFQVNNQAHALEHSIEALVPWLQYYNPDVRITPIMVTAMPEARMDTLAGALAKSIIAYVQQEKLVWGKDVVVLISSDANHYGVDFNNTPYGIDSSAHAKAVAEDQRLMNAYLSGDLLPAKISGLIAEITGSNYREGKNVVWCGRYSIPFGLKLVAQMASRTGLGVLQGQVLHYSDTYSGGVLPLTQTGMGLTAPFSLQHWVGFFTVGYLQTM